MIALEQVTAARAQEFDLCQRLGPFSQNRQAKAGPKRNQ
jgi:hypothetical protein